MKDSASRKRPKAPKSAFSSKARGDSGRDRRKRGADPVEELEARIAPLLEGDGPVLVGPWRGEIGIELTYWIPFLRWLVERSPALRQRMVVISRGGVAGWYDGVCSDYVELFELHEDPAGLLTTEKPQDLLPGDAELLDRARRERELGDVATLHPHLFFQTYRKIRRAEQIPRLREVCRYEPLPLPPPLEGLPAEYVTARFYFNPPFPDSSANQAFAQRTLAALASTLPVVSLNNDMRLDDHHDLGEADDRIITLSDRMTLPNNLGVQTAAIARSRGYVGTYGGLSYVAPFFGVPSVAFMTAPEHMLKFHLDLVNEVFSEPPFGGYFAMSPEQAKVVGLASQAACGSPLDLAVQGG